MRGQAAAVQGPAHRKSRAKLNFFATAQQMGKVVEVLMGRSETNGSEKVGLLLILNFARFLNMPSIAL